MNRKDFLRRLQLELYKLPRHEIDDAIAYYNEYFEEAGPEAEEDVIRELGSPSRIATQIKADYAVRQLESMEGGRNRSRSEETAGGARSGEPGAGSGQAAPAKAPGRLSTAWWVVIGIVGGIFAAPIAIPVAVVLAVLVIGLFIGVVSIIVAALATAVALVGVSIAAVILGFTLLAASAPVALLVIGMGLMGIAFMSLSIVGLVALMNLFFKTLARRHRESKARRAREAVRAELPADKEVL